MAHGLPATRPSVLEDDRRAARNGAGRSGDEVATSLLSVLGRRAGARRDGSLLAGILAVALALRFYGIRWGLPGRVDLNPDEETVLGIVARMDWRHLDPGMYSYGGFFYEACVAVRSLLQLVWPGIGESALVVAYRSVSVVLGATTVALLYVLLRRIAPYGPAPLLGAALLAVMPLHVWDSHFAVTDVTLTFWMTATIAAAVGAYQRPGWQRFTLASACAGLATGTKFNGAFAAVAIALAALTSLAERRVRVRDVLAWGVLGVAAALAALFAASPHVFLKWSATWLAFQGEMSHVENIHYGFNLWAPGWQYRPYLYQIGAAFPFSFGLALYAAVLVGLVYCALHWRRVLIVPFGYAAVYFGVMGRWDFVPIRYYLPFEPVLLIAPALTLAAGLGAPVARVRRWTVVGLGLMLVYTLAFTLSTTARFADDTRLQAERWLRRVAESHDVLTVGANWYLPVVEEGRVTNLPAYGAMPDEVRNGRPEYVVLTSLHYARAYRQRDGNVAMWETVRRGVLPYRLVQRFQARYVNWRLYRQLDPMYEGYFVSPTIEIYQRTD